MPPPLLSRHLRPCHLPVTAKQVRGVHATARARLSTAGNDSPQTRTAKGDNNKGSALSRPIDAPKDDLVEEKPWWKRALNNVASLGTRIDPSTSTEPKSGPPPSPPYAKDPGRSKAHPHKANRATHQDKQGPVRGLVRFTTTGNHVATRRRERKSAKRKHGHVSTARQTDVAAMRLQIQQLSKQIKALQAHLNVKLTKGQSSSSSSSLSFSPTSAAKRATPGKKPQATQSKTQSLDLALQTHTGRRIRPSYEVTSSEISSLLAAAQAAYKLSITECIGAGRVLANARPDLITRIAPSILRRFLTIIRIAIFDEDKFVRYISTKYQPWMNRLASELNKSSSEALSQVKSLVANDFAKYAKMQVPGDPVVFLSEACHRRRVRAARYIQSIGQELGKHESPILSLVASNFRAHTKAIVNRAYEEVDSRLLTGLGEVCASRYALARARPPGHMTSPSWILKLEKSCAFWEMEKSEIAVTELEKEFLSMLPKGYVLHDTTADSPVADDTDDGQRMMRQIHTQSRSITSSTELRVDSKDSSHEVARAEEGPEAKQDVSLDDSSQSLPPSEEVSEQSLLEELFPEANSVPPARPTEKSRDQYPRLALPKSIVPESVGGPRKEKKRATEPFQQHGEQTAVLQLTNCSTGLTEADFRRIIPKGKHLEGWRRDIDFYKVIPGRDPLSLERLPFYYLLFKNTRAALAYQKNASRLHKLSARYQPSSILSAMPPPKGFLEEGEDIGAAVASYNLLPKDHAMSLSVLMQPYNPALRLLIERGGYQPIAPGVDEKGKRIWRVLLHIEGYEPSASDIYIAICTDAYKQGSLVPLRNESRSSIHRLRDMINLKMSSKLISSSRPRAYGTFDHSDSPVTNAMSSSSSSMQMTYDDPEIQSMMGGVEEDRPTAQLHQEVMNRVYNRWVLDFEDEHGARRWCLRWHRTVFPEPIIGRESAWKDSEEVRMCNAEVLW